MLQDSVGNYYDCRLTLAPAVDPVCCPYGFIFSREAILENLLAQKKANKKKKAAWEAQQLREKQKEIEMDVICLLYTSPSPRDVEESRMPSSA